MTAVEIGRKIKQLRIQKGLTLEELASQASLSPFYFSRLFKKCMGISPSEYGKRFHQ